MIFIFGYGYTANFFCEKIIDQKIFATSRSIDNKVQAHKNISIISPLETEYILEKYTDEISHILISVPPDDAGDIFLRTVNFDLTRLNQLKWIGYLSATSVYGDHQGRYVDENSELLTVSKRGKNRKLAEDQWYKIAKNQNLPLHIFRIAGIYGPERNMLERIKSGNYVKVIKKGHFFSRIHVNDLTNTLIASMHKPNPISVYNIADDHPSSIDEVTDYIAKNISITVTEEINYEDFSKKEQAESFFSENKKVNNKLIKEELGIILEYPSYKEGYNKIINLTD